MTDDNADNGYVCKCCGSYIKRYKRSMNCNMALAAIALYRYANGKHVHVEELLQKKGYKRCGDFTYLRHYGIIEKKEGKRDDGSKRNGLYKLTGRGVMFVEGTLEVNANFYMFNNALDGFGGEMIGIHKALGKKFDYSELMGTDKPITVKEHTRKKASDTVEGDKVNNLKLFDL